MVVAPAALFCIFLCWCFILERTKSARGSSRLDHKGPLVYLDYFNEKHYNKHEVLGWFFCLFLWHLIEICLA